MFYNSVLCSIIWVHFWVNVSGRDGIKKVKGGERPAFLPHPAPISLSNSSHPCHCHHTGLCANPAPTRHPAVLHPPPHPRICLPTSSGLSSNAAIPFMAFPRPFRNILQNERGMYSLSIALNLYIVWSSFSSLLMVIMYINLTCLQFNLHQHQLFS